MRRAHRRDAAFRLALVLLCALAAGFARATVAADTLPDATDLAITLGTLAAVVAALLLTIRLMPSRGGVLAKSSLPVALLAVVAVFLAKSYADTCVEAESLIMSARPDGPPAVIGLGPHGDDIRLAGEIRSGDAARLKALLDANPKVTRIALTSEGGLADEGAALGEVIAAHELVTYVPDYCVSACTLAFVAGHERLAMQDARLGFHAPFEEGLFGQTFRGDPSAARAAYVAAGVDADFVDEALETASGDMWYPEPGQLTEANVVTAFVDRDQLPDSNLDFDASPKGARETVLRNFPILAGLDAAKPALVERIADWYLEAYRHDWSEGRVVAALHALSDSAVALAVAGADDPALVALGRYAARAMQAADPQDCQAIGARGDLVTAATVLGRTDESAVATAASLVGAAMKGPRRTAAAAGSPHAGSPHASSMLVAYRDRAPQSCADLRQAYATTLSRPLPEAARLLRPRFIDWARRSIAPLAAAISDEGAPRFE